MPNSSMQTKTARLRLHKAMVDEFKFVTLKMRLCTEEPFNLSDSMTTLPITEATFPGYLAQQITGWADPVSLGTVSIIRTDQPTFNNTDIHDVPILGWYVTDADGKIWFAYKYDTPFILTGLTELSIPFVHQYRMW